jgi:divalent metal cation (Fe/Co/Zn/Cd) transporter
MRSVSAQLPLLPPVRHGDEWRRAARSARRLALASLVWMTIEGAVGLRSGVEAGSVALVGWALSSVVEGLASLIVIWRFTGSRTLSETAEGRAQKAVAISFWVLAPYVALEALHSLLTQRHPQTSILGMAITASSLILMPALSVAKRRLGRRLDSGATRGEGAQNMLCAYLAAAVLLGLLVNTLFGWWWADSLAAFAVAGLAVKEGVDAWRGDDCCQHPGLPLAARTTEEACSDACCAGDGRESTSRGNHPAR